MSEPSAASEADKIRARLAANDPTLTAVELVKTTPSSEVDEYKNKKGNSSSSRDDAAILWIANQEDLQLAAQALRGNTFVERLSVVGGVTVTDEILEEVLPSLSRLRHLKLQRAGLSVATAKTLVKSSTSSTHCWMQQLLTLDLSDNVNLGPRGCRQLAEGLRRTTQLLELDLSNVRMGHYGSQALAESSLPRTLQRLNLSHNGIGPDGLWKLAEAALPALAALQHLDLSYNNILDDGCLEIAKLLVHTTKVAQPSLVTLRLAGNGIGDTGVTGLAKALGQHTCSSATPILLLEELDLHDNRITDGGAISLAEEALSSRKLREEAEEEVSTDGEEDEESDSSIPDAEPVGEHHQWKLLNLSKNQIGNAGCSALAVALSSPASVVAVHSLDLSHNSIGDEGAGNFVELIDDMVGLVALDLSGNPELTEARTRILDMLMKHRRHGEATDHSERSEHTQTTTTSAHTAHQQQQPLDHSIASMDHHQNQQQDEERIRIENLQTIEEGHNKLMECLTIRGDRVSSKATEIPQAYASHLTANFSAKRIVQYGAFGPLYTATLNNNTENGATESNCAILYVRHLKLQPPGAMTAARNAMLQEMVQLSARAHESLWLPLAYTTGPTSYCFVYHSNAPHSRTSMADLLRDEMHTRHLTWKARIRCLRAVIQALAFLHSHDAGHKSTFHGDVCSQNIFLVRQGNDKQQGDYSDCIFQLVDGGLSRLLATDRPRFAAGDVVFGSRGYRCPRYERGSCPYDSASDLFSFGIVVAEITTGRLQGSKQKQPAKSKVSSNTNPTRSSVLAWDAYYELSGILTKQPTIPVDPKAGPVPKNLIEMIAKILLSCITPVVERRPTSTTVANILSQISFA